MPRAFPILIILAAGCSEPRTAIVRHLVDMSEVDASGLGRLDAVVKGSPSPSEVRDVAIHGDRRPSLVVETPARVSFRYQGSGSGRLRFGVAVRPPESSVSLTLAADGEAIWEESWAGARDWVEREIELPHARRSFELNFDGEGVTVMLSHPAIVRHADVERPNVIVYVIDCLRADHVGVNGYRLETTPAIDALAADSVNFEDLMACAPWTKPSTACLFTSLLPIHHQARTVDDALSQARTTVAEVFRDHGYTTAAWVANPVIDPRLFFFNQGFDRWVDLRSFEERTEGSHINAIDPDAAEITARVLPWLEEHRRDTFFLYLHSLDLHYEYRPRPPFDDIFVTQNSIGLERDRELYDNELAYNDHEIGKLVDHLKELGLYDDTILFVTADHGEEFGEHGATRHGKTLYQQALHIPGVLKLPDSRWAGQRTRMLIGNVDIAPTLLQLAGIVPPEPFQGSREIVDAMARVVQETNRPAFAELVAPQHVSYAVRGERFKHIKNLAPEPAEYAFDLENDPHELDSLLPDPPEEAMPLLAALDRFMQLGQHGLHVSIRGGAPGARVIVEARTDARIAQAFRFAIATGDVLKLGPDRKSATLSFTASEVARHLVVQTSPEAAPVQLEVRSDGKLVERRTLDAAALEVSVANAERLMNAREDDALRVWYVPFTAGRNRVELDEEATRNLRALGYIQ